MLQLCKLEREVGNRAVFLNVEGCSDELTFAEKLIDGLRQENLHPELLDRFSHVFRKIRQTFSGGKLGVAGIDVEMGDVEDPDHSTLGRALESIFRKIESTEDHVLIVIDEMPELLLALTKQEHGADRVGQLLHRLRAWRQTYRHRIRWIFLGSIGLDSFVDDRNLRKTINDLTPFSLDALTESEADAFLEKLGKDNNLPLPQEVRQIIIQRVGWPLPHHLQMVFHAMRDAEVASANPAAVESAFAVLHSPQHLSQFDTWRQRLNEQFNAVDAAVAKEILLHLCRHSEGRKRPQIFNALMNKRPQADADAVEEQLARLLLVLQRDGYLLESDGFYAFRSFLLRDYWHRREVV